MFPSATVTNGQVGASSTFYQGIQLVYSNTGTPSANYGIILATNPGATFNNLCLNASFNGPTNAFLGVNTNAPAYTLDVNGNTRISGNLIVTGTVSSASDYRIKENVRDIEADDCHFLDALRPVLYEHAETGETCAGLIAHELQEWYPFLVSGEKDGDKLQTVNYTGLIALLIRELQMLKRQQAAAAAAT